MKRTIVNQREDFLIKKLDLIVNENFRWIEAYTLDIILDRVTFYQQERVDARI